ncbi:MAG: hypothetical protein LBT97_03270 [Planctomycetota bacterium]|jgi:hypothetical protein|nr:hypothetical protein [Planctomycetota bacterium]
MRRFDSDTELETRVYGSVRGALERPMADVSDEIWAMVDLDPSDEIELKVWDCVDMGLGSGSVMLMLGGLEERRLA